MTKEPKQPQCLSRRNGSIPYTSAAGSLRVKVVQRKLSSVRAAASLLSTITTRGKPLMASLRL